VNRKLIAIIALAALVTTGAFAQLALGFTGASYSDTTARDAFANFRTGEGVFYGPFVELGLGGLALGVSGNFSFYQQDMSYNQDGSYIVKMVDYDVAGYLQGHLFGYKSFLDPFVEAGIGQMGTSFANRNDNPNPGTPLYATNYWQIGAGLGLNFGGLGIFTKILYMTPFSEPATASYTYTDSYGAQQTGYYDLQKYPLKRPKVILGAKLIL